MAQRQYALEVVNSEVLTDADWDAINKVRRAYDSGGLDAFWSELETLGDDDFVFQLRGGRSFFPDEIREAIKDELAESGNYVG